MRLQTVRPLPSKWDGQPIEWSDLALVRGSVEVHLPPKCDACGSTRSPWHASGVVLTARDPRTGKAVRRLALHVERCQDCQHDVVHDERTGETWDLGPEDYGREGSSAVEGSLW